MDFIAIGIQRSGTNYLESLIQENFEGMTSKSRDETYIWKHRCRPEDVEHKLDPTKLHLLIYKNPYKWAESIMRFNADLERRVGGDDYQYADLYSEKRRGDVIVRDRKGRRTNLGGGIRLWSDLLGNWLSTRLIEVIPVKYEELLIGSSRERVLAEIGLARGLARKDAGAWVNPSKVGQSERWDEAKSRHNLDQTRISLLSQRQIDVINRNLDRELMDRLGYEIIRTSSRPSWLRRSFARSTPI
ncbi:MAG: hypothetical protein CL908_15250 [Deltaproteobacteria bacterium]|nr:hypothetical protein [Deltaproteobacteria bacterium]